MSHSTVSTITHFASKSDFYANLLREARSLVDAETDYIANTANIASLVHHEINRSQLPHNRVNWTGFYFLRHSKQLVLGPFQGNPACIRINVGRGVCGSCVAKRHTILVEDVHKFPGHISCDSASQSEIVIPLIINPSDTSQEGVLVGVFDLDSSVLNGFDEEDKIGLESIAAVIVKACDWSSLF